MNLLYFLEKTLSNWFLKLFTVGAFTADIGSEFHLSTTGWNYMPLSISTNKHSYLFHIYQPTSYVVKPATHRNDILTFNSVSNVKCTWVRVIIFTYLCYPFISVNIFNSSTYTIWMSHKLNKTIVNWKHLISLVQVCGYMKDDPFIS